MINVKKKIIIVVTLVVILSISIYYIHRNYEIKKTPTLVNVNHVNYALTEEPSNVEKINLDYQGRVKNKVGRYKTPEKNLTSNFLKESTPIYSGKDGSIVYYEKNKQLFVAREMIR